MQFLNYKDRLIKSISDNLVEARRSCSTASVHDLRVGIKRLRSLLHLLTEIDIWFEQRHFEHSFRRLFKAAGRVRDLHVAEELIWKWAAGTTWEVSEYYNFLKDKEVIARQSFLAVCKNFRMRTISDISAAISSHTRGIPQSQFERVVGRNTADTLLKIASHKTGGPVPLEELHSLRIETKDARYRIQVLDVINNQKDYLKKTDAWLRSLHQSIGFWHDTIAAATKLHSFLSNDVVQPVYSPASYESLAAELQKRADEAHTRFIELWRDKENILNKSIEQLQVKNI